MRKLIVLAALIQFTSFAPAVLAQDPAPSSTREGIKRDAADAKQGVKRSAHEVKNGIKSGAREFGHAVKSAFNQVGHGIAVAQCNDGEYSYTHFRTCNHHGGIRARNW